MLEQAKELKLDNGLRVVKTATATDSVTALLLVKVGSRDETDKLNGISHFLEHVVFKGTKKWSSPMVVNRVIESKGGVFNAFTGKEYTGFWVKLAKEHLKLGLQFLKEVVFEPLLPKVELERERGVILEEIKMYQDNPMANVARAFVSQLYSSISLGNYVIGKADNVRRFRREDFVKHLNSWYSPSRMVLSVAGGVDKKVFELARQVFSKAGRQGGGKKSQQEIDVSQNGQRFGLITKKIEQAHFCLGVRALKRSDKNSYVLMVLNTILGGNTSSRLWNEIREKRGLVYYVRSSVDAFTDTGYLMIQAGCGLKNLNQAIAIAKNQSLGLTARVVTDNELRRAKDYLKGRLSLSLEDSRAVADLTGEDVLFKGRARRITEMRTRIEQVTKEEIKKLAQDIFAKDKFYLTVIADTVKKNVYLN